MKYALIAAVLLVASPTFAETIPPITYTVEKSGPAAGGHPTRKSAVKIRYEGRFLDGKVFDSSKDGPDGAAIFPLGRLIPGWVTVVPLMRPGDVWTVTLPPPYAYDAAGSGDTIPPNSTLVFRIELVDFAAMPPQPTMEPMTTLPGR